MDIQVLKTCIFFFLLTWKPFQILYFISRRVFTVRHHCNRSRAISLHQLIKNDAGSPHEEHARPSFAFFHWLRTFRTVLTSLQGLVHFTVFCFFLFFSP